MTDRDYTTVVTGLPRSGTSMMMQMLVAGGLPALADEERIADEDNLRGYFELEAVKRLQHSHSCLENARGYCVKVVSHLLAHLPQGDYRVILVERELDEVLSSQQAMLTRNGKQGARLSTDQLKAVFARQLTATGKLLEERQLPLLRVAHRTCIEQPAMVTAQVNEFLGGDLDEARMAQAVDETLYRQRV